ncbi:hypothetical protein IKS86_09435 [bacterium]|nr:hypothetical protein [bacterium]
MVNRIYKILCTLFCAFILFSCMSHGNAVVVDNDSVDTTSEISDVSDSATDEDYTEDEDSAENSDDSEKKDILTDEDVDFVEDSDTAETDEDTDSDDDFDVSTDEDNDSTEEPDVVPDEEVEDTEPYDGDSIQIRIVAGNISSRKENVCSQCYDPGHGIRIFQALKPDIALVQEMNYKNNSTSDYKSFAQQIVGTNYYAVDSADYQIPNGVVSRYPITSHGYWKDPNISNRALMWAVVDIPGNTDIFAISVHLHTSPDSDQVKAAQVIVDEIAKVKANNPGKYYYVVGGDFNGTSAVSSNGFGKNNTFYVDGPHPVDEKGDEETNAGRKEQYDFVLADYPLHGFQVPTVYYSSKDSTKTKSYANGLVFDTRVYTQSVLDEYFSPAQTSDSKADEMQHMAVVKDFLIELK